MTLSIGTLDRMAGNTGCSVHNDCLTCPLEECRYVDARVYVSHAARRHTQIRRLAEQMTTHTIAEHLGISIRTVQRALKEQ